MPNPRLVRLDMASPEACRQDGGRGSSYGSRVVEVLRLMGPRRRTTIGGAGKVQGDSLIKVQPASAGMWMWLRKAQGEIPF